MCRTSVCMLLGSGVAIAIVVSLMQINYASKPSSGMRMRDVFEPGDLGVSTNILPTSAGTSVSAAAQNSEQPAKSNAPTTSVLDRPSASENTNADGTTDTHASKDERACLAETMLNKCSTRYPRLAHTYPAIPTGCKPSQSVCVDTGEETCASSGASVIVLYVVDERNSNSPEKQQHDEHQRYTPWNFSYDRDDSILRSDAADIAQRAYYASCYAQHAHRNIRNRHMMLEYLEDIAKPPSSATQGTATACRKTDQDDMERGLALVVAMRVRSDQLAASVASMAAIRDPCSVAAVVIVWPVEWKTQIAVTMQDRTTAGENIDDGPLAQVGEPVGVEEVFMSRQNMASMVAYEYMAAEMQAVSVLISRGLTPFGPAKAVKDGAPDCIHLPMLLETSAADKDRRMHVRQVHQLVAAKNSAKMEAKQHADDDDGVCTENTVTVSDSCDVFELAYGTFSHDTCKDTADTRLAARGKNNMPKCVIPVPVSLLPDDCLCGQRDTSDIRDVQEVQEEHASQDVPNPQEGEEAAHDQSPNITDAPVHVDDRIIVGGHSRLNPPGVIDCFAWHTLVSISDDVYSETLNKHCVDIQSNRGNGITHRQQPQQKMNTVSSDEEKLILQNAHCIDQFGVYYLNVGFVCTMLWCAYMFFYYSWKILKYITS